jgi:hypothetical protein
MMGETSKNDLIVLLLYHSGVWWDAKGKCNYAMEFSYLKGFVYGEINTT